jgi:hypothetical protein
MISTEVSFLAAHNSGDYDHLVASLSRIQRTLEKKDKPGMTWRSRRAEQVNEILGSVYHDDDLSMDEVMQAIQDFKGGRTVLCAAKEETSFEFMSRMFCCNFLRKS